jgi:hypothetical protein
VIWVLTRVDQGSLGSSRGVDFSFQLEGN